MKTQRELRKHLSQVLARDAYDRAEFKVALEDYLSAHRGLDEEARNHVRWTTPGVWIRFIDNCWAEYREYRQLFGRDS